MSPPIINVADYQIVPMPLEITTPQQSGFLLKSGETIYYTAGNEKMKKNAEFLASFIKEQTGIELKVQEGDKESGIVLKLGLEATSPEAYHLTVDGGKVVIEAPSEAGVFYGIQTLRKSVSVHEGGGAIELPAVEINDTPRFSYRGMMLDVGRHMFTMDEIKTYTPISQLIQSRLPISIQVGGMAVTLGAIAGLVLGILAALKRDTVVDSIATIISVIGVSVPSYVFALALSYTFGFKFRWFPMLFSAKDIFGSSVLPSISLSMFTMASIARFTRSEMIEVLDSDYMLLAVLGPGMNSYTYSGQDLSQKNFAPRVPGIEQFGILDGSEKMSTTTGTKVTNAYQEKDKLDVYYWFGSDLYGRDIWTRTWEGARVSLIIAVAAAIIDMVIGMSYGLISGYFGGRVDMVMQRFLEVANGIPRLVIVTLLLLVLQPGMVTIIFALMLTEWVGMSRIARAEMLKLKDQEFVLASRTLGAGSFFIIFKEVLPNIIGPIITQVMFSIPTAIFTEAFLSFVGLGIPVPQCSLGSLISELYNSFTTHPYQIIPPMVVMSLLMMSFNLVADGLREALDPKMKSM